MFLQLQGPRNKRFYMDGPNGGSDINSFQMLAIDDVGQMAVTNVSFEQVAAFAQCAAQGGSGIQRVVQGPGMQFKFSLETFTDIVKAKWFDEDWRPLMQSPFVTKIAHNACAGSLDPYQGEVQRLLCACVLPMAGLTLAKATHNFHIAEFKNSSIAMETVACFSAGQVCICNEVALPSRLEWTGFATPTVQDATPHVVDGLNWKAHYVNVAQFFTITDDGLMLHENILDLLSSNTFTFWSHKK